MCSEENTVVVAHHQCLRELDNLISKYDYEMVEVCLKILHRNILIEERYARETNEST